jgi:hypothetical protein
MSNVFDQWRETARRKAQELDEKLDLKTKLEQSVNIASDLARKAGEAVNEAATVTKEKVAEVNTEYRVSENLREGARAATETAADVGKAAGQTAQDIFGAAQGFYKKAEKAYEAGASGARLTDATFGGYAKARQWIKENPGKTAGVTFSLIAGIRLGSALPGLGATVLGSTIMGNWFFHSALPIVGLRKLTETYTDFLKDQEKRLANGELDEAERASLEFQRNMTKYVGAPLLGAFSMAAGASMIGSAFSGATVTGLPLNLILGGNPLLNGVWFFANGVVCIVEGYRFFMIALADEEEVQRVVREIKGLLPAATTTATA